LAFSLLANAVSPGWKRATLAQAQAEQILVKVVKNSRHENFLKPASLFNPHSMGARNHRAAGVITSNGKSIQHSRKGKKFSFWMRSWV